MVLSTSWSGVRGVEEDGTDFKNMWKSPNQKGKNGFAPFSGLGIIRSRQ